MILQEIYRLLESKMTEAQALNILKKGGVENPEAVVAELVKIDKSKNQKNLAFMAFIYASGYTDLGNISSVFEDFDKLEMKNRIKPITIVKTEAGGALRIGDKQFNDFLKFSEYIHGEKNKYAEKRPTQAVDAFEAEDKPIWSGNNIDIYDGTDVGKCIKYSQGGLTGRGYGFCIGAPGNTMYQSYRDTKTSSFYFIVDRNRFKQEANGSVDLSDPLHIVVFDNTKMGIELTDANNTTGSIAEFGKDVNKYVAYLQSKGVPVEKLANKPKSSEEEEEDRLLRSANTSLEWFMKLPIEMKSKYIGRGHLLTDEQFDYLLGTN